MTLEIKYLKSLLSVREQSRLLLSHTEHLTCFDVDLSKIEDVVSLILSLIKRDYNSPADIPSHSRWCHFVGVDLLKDVSGSTLIDQSIALIDLFVVSVLLDAGAGDNWTFNKNSNIFNRSEGLALASFEMFKSGVFSSKGTQIKYLK